MLRSCVPSYKCPPNKLFTVRLLGEERSLIPADVSGYMDFKGILVRGRGFRAQQEPIPQRCAWPTAMATSSPRTPHRTNRDSWIPQIWHQPHRCTLWDPSVHSSCTPRTLASDCRPLSQLQSCCWASPRCPLPYCHHVPHANIYLHRDTQVSQEPLQAPGCHSEF